MKANVNGNAGRKYPYARLKGMEDFMKFAKEPGWRPPKFDAEVLRTMDVAKGKEREAVAALRFLGIIDATGAPTEVFDGLKTDYQGTLRRQVQAGYAELFAMFPPKMVN